MSKFNENRIFVLNEPSAPRLNPALAVEIGLNESLLFLQLEFLIAISGKEIDGRRWVYESTTDLQVYFPFWGRMTINRAIKSLEQKGLIVIGNYNLAKYDRTRWFAINMEQAARLSSITVGGYVTRSDQNGTRSAQNGTTIPETSTERSTSSPAVEIESAQPETGNDDDALGKEAGQEGPTSGAGSAPQEVAAFPASPAPSAEDQQAGFDLLMQIPNMDPVQARKAARCNSLAQIKGWTAVVGQGFRNRAGYVISRLASGEVPPLVDGAPPAPPDHGKVVRSWAETGASYTEYEDGCVSRVCF